MVNEKGGVVAPLFFLALAFAGIGSRLGSVWPWAVSALALAFLGRLGSRRQRDFYTPLTIAVVAYCVLVVLSATMVSPAYSPAGLYHPLLLFLGYWSARRLDDAQKRSAGFALLVFAIGLAIWGLVQVGPRGFARGQGLFETPATYAAVLNLVLVPVLAALLWRRSRVRGALLVGILLAAALWCAGSRGGQLALVAGIGVAATIAVRAKLWSTRGAALAVVAIVAGWVAVSAVRHLPSAAPEQFPAATAQAESSISRLELFALSWAARGESAVAGTGYLTYRYTLEQGREQVPSYGERNVTWFVHNDYLQTLQELGPIGMLAFLCLTGFPLVVVLRKLPNLSERDRKVTTMAASALTAMSVHALVDYPFYVPICLLLYGTWAGVLDSKANPEAPIIALQPPKTPVLAARAAILALAAVALLRPVLAEAAAELGLRKFVAGDGPNAAFWLGVAQRVDAADWRYHWYAGQFWEGQAADSGRAHAARLAAAAYSRGFTANPIEVRNLLGLISVHRRHRELLEAPADRQTLLAWLALAQRLAPLDPDVQRARRSE